MDLDFLMRFLAPRPRFGHWLAAKLGFIDVHRMFCPCCPEWDDWAADDDL